MRLEFIYAQSQRFLLERGERSLVKGDIIEVSDKEGKRLLKLGAENKWFKLVRKRKEDINNGDR